jgi:hypothetical protein
MRLTRNAAIGVAIACGTALAGPAAAQADQYRQELVKIGCRATPNEYTGGYLIKAHPVFTMITKPGKQNNLQAMKIKARLIPTTTGSNISRNWRENKRTDVSADGANRKQVGVWTEPQSDSFDWNLQVELTWDRRGKRDWHFKQVYRFDEGFCQS